MSMISLAVDKYIKENTALHDGDDDRVVVVTSQDADCSDTREVINVDEESSSSHSGDITTHDNDTSAIMNNECNQLPFCVVSLRLVMNRVLYRALKQYGIRWIERDYTYLDMLEKQLLKRDCHAIPVEVDICITPFVGLVIHRLESMDDSLSNQLTSSISLGLSRLMWRYEQVWLLIEIDDNMRNTSSILQNALQLIDSYPLSWLRILFSTSSKETAQHINTIYRSLMREGSSNYCAEEYHRLFEQTSVETTHERFLLMTRCFNVMSARIALNIIGLRNLLDCHNDDTLTMPAWHQLAKRIPRRSIQRFQAWLCASVHWPASDSTQMNESSITE
ncbi:hypothetical protein BDF22DRAFT_745896 [Syncephalis plumigaleata]|nr:hypothetical protein BDF22DRAFT_745896 [Syncephalis plumigaleata]